MSAEKRAYDEDERARTNIKREFLERKNALRAMEANQATHFSGSTTSQAPAAPSMGSGLFGAPSQPASTGANTGSTLFGQAPTTSQTAQIGSSPSTLFGGAAATGTNMNQSAAPPGTGLFGGLQQNNSSLGGGVLGASQGQQAQQMGANPFGNTAAQNTAAQTAHTAALGPSSAENQNQNMAGMLGSSSMFTKGPQTALNAGAGQSGPASQQQNGLLGATSTDPETIPGARIDLVQIRSTTRFNDLHDDIQSQIKYVDNMIQAWMKQNDELDAFMPGHGASLQNLPNDVEFVSRKFDGAQHALQSDAEAIEIVAGMNKQDADSARLSFRAIDNLRLPKQYHTSDAWSGSRQPNSVRDTEADGQHLVGFFTSTAKELEGKLQRYSDSLTEIESHLHGVQEGLGEKLQKMLASRYGRPSGAEDRIAELGAVLRDFEQSILKVANVVGGVREGVTQLQLGEFMHANHRNGAY